MDLFILLFGLIMGSFTNVLIYRLPRGESVVLPGSHCTNCNHPLAWYDNIPILSYIMLRGKCRYCGTSISFQYPLVEAINALCYLLLFWSYGPTLDFVFLALISSMLIAISGTDMTRQVIPDILVISVFMLSVIHKVLAYFLYHESPEIWQSVLGLIAAGGLFLLITVVSKGGMGQGDVTLISALGFALGLKKILLVTFLSFVIAACASLILLGTKTKTLKDPIPFGAFIVVAFFITVFLGDMLIGWYIGLLTAERGFECNAVWREGYS